MLLGEFEVHGAEPLHVLVRAARAGDTIAVAELISRVSEQATRLLPPMTSVAVVPVPSHLPGTLNPLLEQVAAVLATTKGWTVANKSLVRCHPAPEAKTAPVRDAASEVASLDWTSPPGRTIVLLDDVVRSGTTLRVCAERISATGDGRPIVPVVLARALDGVA